MSAGHTVRRPRVAVAVTALAAAGAAGALAMTVFHLDLYRAGAVPVGIVVGFAVGAVAFAVVGLGVWRGAAWAWPAAVLVNGLGFVSSLVPWRGPQALLPAVVTAAALVVLLSRSGRAALLTER